MTTTAIITDAEALDIAKAGIPTYLKPDLTELLAPLREFVETGQIDEELVLQVAGCAEASSRNGSLERKAGWLSLLLYLFHHGRRQRVPGWGAPVERARSACGRPVTPQGAHDFGPICRRAQGHDGPCSPVAYLPSEGLVS
ncbi:hypothetical protein PAI11_37790 [Patulibacter medicamentivorans]|uniref:Uncharacterized protein n=1 Tax=Patulibacter medicamentivorans TaxID=1097667 RepID=H0EAA5_9ACTN|nr:hypothetical protein [Patulibacter medicamentivorans]EHN09445.1 hypothetical protein PAI11_37790 [Patulibacter medicamentivorans]